MRKFYQDHSFMSISCQNQFYHKQYSHPRILPISAQGKPSSLCRDCSCCYEICSLGLPTKPFLATVERRSFRDDGAVNVERSESSKILSKSLESSFIKKQVRLDQRSPQLHSGRLLLFLESK